MSLKSYLWDKTLSIVFNIAGLFGVTLFVGLTANVEAALLIAAGWVLFASLYYTVGYLLLKKRIAQVAQTAAETEDKFLLCEVIPEPQRSEDRLYYELMTLQGSAAIARVTQAEKEKAAYYDYIQEWVHEVKIPITAISLICADRAVDDFREIARQVARINDYTEQVLYEAKSNNTEKDLLIRETDLASVVGECIRDNKRYFIDAGVSIETDVGGTVYTDGKWLGFVLKQILQNASQYAKGENAQVRIRAAVLPGDRLELSVWDNGVGIAASDLPRIFDKGFTGSNGRRNRRSTGLGLYLCKKLCDALDIKLAADSVCSQFTRLSLVFNAPAVKNLTLRNR